MTERLKQLLDGEAHDLSVPPPADRCRRSARAAACAAATGLAAGACGRRGRGHHRRQCRRPVRRRRQPGRARPGRAGGQRQRRLRLRQPGVLRRPAAPDRDPGQRREVAVLHLGGRPRPARREPLERRRRTAAVLAGHPRRRRPPLRLVTEETVHASDPDQPYVVYGEAVDGELQVVVYDVATDAEAARVTRGLAPARHWFPVAIDGDTVYVQDRSTDEIFAVDWSAGTAEASDLGERLGGRRRARRYRGRRAAVGGRRRDRATCSSPSDRTATSTSRPTAGTPSSSSRTRRAAAARFEVYDVDHRRAGHARGQPVRAGAGPPTATCSTSTKPRVTTCDSATGECTVESYSQPTIPDPPDHATTMSDPVCPARQPGRATTTRCSSATATTTPTSASGRRPCPSTPRRRA